MPKDKPTQPVVISLGEDEKSITIDYVSIGDQYTAAVENGFARKFAAVDGLCISQGNFTVFVPMTAIDAAVSIGKARAAATYTRRR